jgi:hypothetical protein
LAVPGVEEGVGIQAREKADGAKISESAWETDNSRRKPLAPHNASIRKRSRRRRLGVNGGGADGYSQYSDEEQSVRLELGEH